MAERVITFVQYNDLELHPLLDARHEWFLSITEVAQAFDVDISTITAIKESKQSTLTEGRHYQYEEVLSGGIRASRILLWSKKGILRLAYYLKSDAALKFLDFTEDLHLHSDQGIDAQSQHMYDEVEESLLGRLKQLKDDKDMSLEELNKLIYTVDNLASKKAALHSEKSEPSTMESLFSGLMKMVQDPQKVQSGMGGFMQKSRQELLHTQEPQSSGPTPDPFETMKPIEKIKTDSEEKEKEKENS